MKSKKEHRTITFIFALALAFQQVVFAAGIEFLKGTNEGLATIEKKSHEQNDDYKEPNPFGDQRQNNPFAQGCSLQSLGGCNSDVQCPDNKRFFDTKSNKMS